MSLTLNLGVVTLIVLIPFTSNSRTRVLNLTNWATWIPKEKGLVDAALAGSIVDPPVAKLHPFWKFGMPIESKYGLRNERSNAFTAAYKYA